MFTGGDFFLAPITLSQELQNQIQGLTPLQQQKVLDFVRTLSTSQIGTPGSKLVQFAGSLSPEEGKSISEAIHEGCGLANPGGW